MTRFQLVLRSLFHYWRTNLAILFGVIIATSVIAGALMVGDSVRQSLRQMTLDRLGQVDHAVQSHRYFRESLAAAIEQSSDFNQRFSKLAPVLSMQASLERQIAVEALESAKRQFAGGVSVYGIDDRFVKLTNSEDWSAPTDRDVVINQRLAEELNVQAGDEVTLWIELPATIPREAILGEREEVSKELVVTVKEILPETDGLARFDLNPSQQLPRVAFLSLDTLQELVELNEGTPRNPRPARVNALFAAAKSTDDQSGESADAAAKSLNQILVDELGLADIQLRLDEVADRNYLSLESESLFLEDNFVWAAEAAAEAAGLPSSAALVYLANRVSNVAEQDETAKTGYSMYSIVAGLDFATATGQFGPFKVVAGSKEPPATGEIVLTDWWAKDLQATVGTELKLDYHTVGSHADLPEETRTFKVHSIIQLKDTVADDRELTPSVKGFTNVRTLQDLDLPFPVRKELLTKRDDDYWELYRATPKAYVSLDTAQEMWRSRYGRLTSLRIGLGDDFAEETAAALSAAILKQMDARALGLGFQPVKANGLRAAVGANNFTVLFLAFSFFLIFSAAVLIGLLFRLGLERRVSSIGLLSAIGFAPRGVRRVFGGESLLVVICGAVLGIPAAIGYAALMIHGLKTWWYGAIGTKFLELTIRPVSLIAGFGGSIFVALLVIWLAFRQFKRLSARQMLAGDLTDALSAEIKLARIVRLRTIARAAGIVAAVLSLAAVTGLIPAQEAFSGFSYRIAAFFVVGLAFLVASLCGFAVWLATERTQSGVRGKGVPAAIRLGWRNAARNRLRSISTVALIAFATFVIVAVAAGHRNPSVENPDLNSGNGGFSLVAESSQPVLFDLNSANDREELGFEVAADSGDAKLLNETTIVPFRVEPGEDASCLNLYQTTQPTILGVPHAMIERGGFRFADTPAAQWNLLETDLEDDEQGPLIPVLGDMNTLMYSLKKGIGTVISVPSEDEPQYRLKVVGMFDASVFQGVVLMSENNFRRLFPTRAGYQYFLVDTPDDRKSEQAVAQILETNLAPVGFDAERVADRLANFLAVQNTYLSTFQTLGGLGLLLGTFGLAAIMLRNVLERRSEFALFRSTGFRRSHLTWMVLAENSLLLFWGLLTGGIAALLAMGPHLLTTGADLPWMSVGIMLGMVTCIGMLAALFAVVEAVRTPIVETLRS